MARSAGLKLALLAGAVVLAHLAALEWLARQADAISRLPTFVPAMYTRMLQQSVPPPVLHTVSTAAPQRQAPMAARPRPPASAAQQARERARRQAQEELAAQARRAAEEEEEERRAREQQVAQAAAQAASAAASEPAAAASASEPAAAASAPLAAASAPDGSAALDHWPIDSRLSYRLAGEFRGGPLYGDARVQWQREGGKYQVRLDVKIQLFGTQVLTSQGEVTPGGLLPRAYEELRPGKRRVAQLGERMVTLDNGGLVPRPPGVQDTVSQFVELSQRFASGKDLLAVGRTVTLWLARPGGVDAWTYDIVGEDLLQTPTMGDVPAFHLKPRPIANPHGNITAEMWFAPTLQYLPVRIKVLMGSEAFLDLTVDRIDQR